MSSFEKNTLSIERQADGSVRLFDDNARCHVLTADEWAQAVATVSAQGAAPERVALVRNFHMHGDAPRPPEPGWDANGSPID